MKLHHNKRRITFKYVEELLNGISDLPTSFPWLSMKNLKNFHFVLHNITLHNICTLRLILTYHLHTYVVRNNRCSL